MEAQLQIRQNAQEVQEYMRDLFAWEKSVKDKKKPMPVAGSGGAAAPGVPPPRGRAAAPVAARVGDGAAGTSGTAAGLSGSAAGHTHTHYDRWSKFNVDASGRGTGPRAALSSAPGAAPIRGSKRHGSGRPEASPSAPSLKQRAAPTAAAAAPKQAAQPRAPVAKGGEEEPTTAEGWKDRGNALLQAGYFAEAVSCYDRSLAVKPTGLAYANRALAHLKLGANASAEDDASAALALDALYAKAWQRRGAARRALGRWLEAAEDWEGALRLEPGNKTVRAERDACLDEHWKAEGGKPDGALRRRVEVMAAPAAAPAATKAPAPSQPLGASELLRPRQTQAVPKPPLHAAARHAEEGKAAEAVAAAMAAAAAPVAPAATKAEPATAVAPQGGTGPSAATGKESATVADKEPAPAAAAPGPRTPSPIAAAAAAMAARQPSAPEGQQRTVEPPADGSGTAAPPARPPSAQQTAREWQQARLAAAAAAAAEQLAVRLAGELKAPRNSVEFESKWRALRGDAGLQSRYLAMVEPGQLPDVFKDSLTPPVLVAIARAALAAAGSGGGSAGEGGGTAGGGLSQAGGVALLAGLAKVARFPMMAMCLGPKEKQELRGLWDAAVAAQAVPGLAGQLEALRNAYRL
jgi:hypothetical protein